MSSAAAQPDPNPAADPWVVRGEECLAFLREVTEITMTVLRATARHTIAALETPAAEVSAPSNDTDPAAESAATSPTKSAPPRHDPVEKIAKLSRIVRLTITLETKLAESLRAYMAGEAIKAETKRAEAEKDAFAPIKSGRKARVRELLIDAIDRETPDPEDRDVLIDALDERLLCDDAYKHIDDLPLRDIVEHLCADLQLKPDWKRWAGDGWKPGPPFFRPLCSDFSSPSRKPILQDLTGPDPWT